MGSGTKKEDSEEWVKPNVSVGQTVMYSKYSGTEFEVGRGIYVYDRVRGSERGGGRRRTATTKSVGYG